MKVNKTAKLSKKERELGLLVNIVTPIAINHIELLLVTNTFNVGSLEQAKEAKIELDKSPSKNKENLEKIAKENGLSRHVFNKMHVTFILAIFDAFLSDVTKFLLLVNRDKLSSDIQVPISEIIGPKSIATAINLKIEKKCRDSAARSLIERINYLRRTFSIEISISENELGFLRLISSKRNEFVHAHDVFSIQLDRNLQITTSKKTEITVPNDEVNRARELTAELMSQIMRAIAEKYKNEIPLERWTKLVDGPETIFRALRTKRVKS